MKTLKYAWRFLVRSKSYTVINIVGLSLSLACTIILVRYIHQETRVNTHCIDAENVYIPLRDIDGNVFAGSVSDGYSGADTVFYSPEAVKEKARFVTFSNDNVAINGKPYTVQLLAADTAFFHFFTYPLSGTPMKAPNDVLVTRQFAERVFGKENPIGEKLSYSGGHLLTVCGVLGEPACKSSLTFDIVLNLELKNGERGWGKMLVELIRFMPGVDVDAINAISNIYRQADGGTFEVGETVKLAYVDQQHKDIDPQKTVYEVISQGNETLRLGGRDVNARAYISRFNFSGTDQSKLCSVLSGGERNRLQLALALKQEGNVLLLDEPTNDIDVNTLRALEEGLEAFAGCAVVISHDRWFLDRICTHILAFEGNGEVFFFEGSYSEYEINKARRLGDTEIKKGRYRKLMEE